jgi:hypothetical protein
VTETDNHRILRIVISTCSVATVAGVAGLFGSMDGIGTMATFQRPQGICISPNGLFALVSETGNHLIRHILLSTASVTTLAGTVGSSGFTNGIGTFASFSSPAGVKISPDGRFALVCDSGNHLLRRITISTATVATLAGVAGVSGSSNGLGTNAQFSTPYEVTLASNGSYGLIADTHNHMIRYFVLLTTAVTTLAGVTASPGSLDGIGTFAMFDGPRGVSISPDGLYAFVVDFNSNLIRCVDLSTASVATVAGRVGSLGSSNGIGANASFFGPSSIAFSPNGLSALVSDTLNDLIRLIIISPTSVTTLVGDELSLGDSNGIGTNARFDEPIGVSLSSNGLFALIPEFSTHLIRHVVISTASVITLAGLLASPGFSNGIGSQARFYNPGDVSIAPDGLFALIVDSHLHLIRHMVISTASVTTLAGDAGLADATNGMGTNARFSSPTGISLSSDGSFALIADANNRMIRLIVISTTSVTTLTGGGAAVSSGSRELFAANLIISSPYKVVISPNDLFALVTDNVNHFISHIVISTGVVTTLAGSVKSFGLTNGIGSNAKFNNPRGLSISPNGLFVLVADADNHLIRRIILSTASVTTLVGAGSFGTTNGVGTNSRLNSPNGISFSSTGIFALVSDQQSGLIRRIVIDPIVNDGNAIISSLSPTVFLTGAPTMSSFLGSSRGSDGGASIEANLIYISVAVVGFLFLLSLLIYGWVRSREVLQDTPTKALIGVRHDGLILGDMEARLGVLDTSFSSAISESSAFNEPQNLHHEVADFTTSNQFI